MEPPIEPGWVSRCRVVDVHDGDTVTVDVVRRVKVRLLDCWAPELRQPGGQEAAAYLREMLAGREVMLWVPTESADSVDDVFTFGRVLGHLWISGEPVFVSQAMIDVGHARGRKS